jgi:hypothetical protein
MNHQPCVTDAVGQQPRFILFDSTSRTDGAPGRHHASLSPATLQDEALAQAQRRM